MRSIDFGNAEDPNTSAKVIPVTITRTEIQDFERRMGYTEIEKEGYWILGDSVTLVPTKSPSPAYEPPESSTGSEYDDTNPPIVSPPVTRALIDCMNQNSGFSRAEVHAAYRAAEEHRAKFAKRGALQSDEPLESHRNFREDQTTIWSPPQSPDHQGRELSKSTWGHSVIARMIRNIKPEESGQDTFEKWQNRKLDELEQRRSSNSIALSATSMLAAGRRKRPPPLGSDRSVPRFLVGFLPRPLTILSRVMCSKASSASLFFELASDGRALLLHDGSFRR